MNAFEWPSNCLALQVVAPLRETIMEQDKSNQDSSVVFKCKSNEIQKCSRSTLQLSTFFTDKLAAMDRYKNKAEFDYITFTKETITTLLEFLWGSRQIKRNKKVDLEMLVFLIYEGKSCKLIFIYLFLMT